MSRHLKAWLLTSAIIFPGAAAASTAVAADQAAVTTAPPQSPTQEVIITARRRGEQSLAVPDVVTAYSGAQLHARGVKSVSDIARLTPDLVIEPTISNYGSIITLRGLSSPSANVTSEPSVTLYVDGVPMNNGAAIHLAQFDLGQVQVLEGPQSLFFGKNASAGIVSLESAEPRRAFESQVEVGYETVAHEADVEGMVSGAITPQLLGRFAFIADEGRGPFINQAPDVANRYSPGAKEQGLRGTLIWEPNANLRVKLVGAYDNYSQQGSFEDVERIACFGPGGTPQGPGASPAFPNCRAGQNFLLGNLPTNAGAEAGDPLFGNGVGYSHFTQGIAVLNVQYALPHDMTFNSLTGFYDLASATASQASMGPIPVIGVATKDGRWTLTQEARLSSGTTGRFNWMVGGFFQYDHLSDFQDLIGVNINNFLPFLPPGGAISLGHSYWYIQGQDYSVFGQAGYNITKQLSLSAGARYTYEIKHQQPNVVGKGDTFIPDVSYTNVSPEVTLSYQPNGNTNLYVSYKEGFKAGGFQVAPTGWPAHTANIDNSYKPETVQGFEGGVKLALLDHTLRIDTAAYRYVYSNLQESNFNAVTVSNTILNAASVVDQGIEVKVNYSPPIEGLHLNGAINFNQANYSRFLSPCYTGQTIAEGCTFAPGAVAPTENLAGHPVPRAPLWAGNIGFQYDRMVSSKLRLSLASEGIFQTKSFLDETDFAYGVRPATFLVDASIAIGAPNHSWEVALIGKNLTDDYYPVSGFATPLTGSAAGTIHAVPGDYSAEIHRGRELWIRLTIRPGEL